MYKDLTYQDIENIREVVSYDPDTGFFTYKISMPNTKVAAGQPMRKYLGADGRRYQLRVRKRLYAASRVAWLLTYGVWPEGQIDHENHDPGDNRLHNLRLVDAIGNQRNRSLARNNASGINGVSWCSHWQKWRAYVRVDGRAKTLGYFRSIEDAAAARRAADIEIGYHPNHGKAA